MITVTDVLTNKTWNLPNSLGTNPIYLGSLGMPPGRYDVTNGTATTIAINAAPGRFAIIPAGKTWNVATQENDRSVHRAAVDNVIWMHSGRFN